MPNPWGSSLPGLQYYYSQLIGAADVNCPAGVETNIYAIPNATAWGPGAYVPTVLGNMVIALGVTPPTTLFINIRVNNGADLGGVTVSPFLLTASAIINMPVFLWGSGSSGTLWYPGNATLQVSVTPAAQPATVRNTGTNLFYSLLRVQDGS